MEELPIIASGHFIVGSATIMAGAGALFFHKGSNPHKISGFMFLVAMLALCASGVYLSMTRSILFTFFLAGFSAYLVLTGWVSARRADGSTGFFEKLMFMLVLFCALALVALGIAESVFGISTGGDVPAGAYFFLAALAAWFAALDFYALRMGGLSGKHKIARHLWRMCFSMFLATGIFFLGNNQVLPEALRQPWLLNTPVAAVLLVMMFWLVRVWFSKKNI